MESVMTGIVDYLISQSMQVGILCVFVAGACWMLRNASAHWRYLLWCVVLVKCLVPPMVDVSLAVLPAEPVAQEIASTGIIFTEPERSVAWSGIEGGGVIVEKTEVSAVSSLLSMTADIGMAGWIGLAWLTVVVVFALTILVKAYRMDRWIRRSRRSLEVEMRSESERLCQAMDMSGSVKIWVVDGIGQPFVWGWFRGAVYLPSDFDLGSGLAGFRSVLMHELSHVQRGDAAINVMQMFVQVLYFFHPFVWFANVMLRREREKCCDEAVIAQSSVSVKEYGRAIVDVLVNEHEMAKSVPTLAVAGPAKNIEERVKTMMRANRKFYSRPSVGAVLSVFFVAALTLPMTLSLTAKGNDSLEKSVKSLNEIPTKLSVSAKRKLLDKETLTAIQRQEEFGGEWFTVESEYWSMNKGEKSLVLSQWVSESQDYTDMDRQVSAIASLGNVGDKRGTNALIKVVNSKRSGSNRPRWVAARGLGRIGEYRAVPALISVLDHINKDTRICARVSLCEITGIYLGEDKGRWQEWWEAEGREISRRQGKGLADGKAANGPGIDVEFRKGLNENVAKLNFGKVSIGRDEVIEILGKPVKYLWERDVFEEDSLPFRYIMEYREGMSMVVVWGEVVELRFHKPGYIFAGSLEVGSTVEEVFEVLPKPIRTEVGGEIGFADGVFYQDIEGKAGYCYYARFGRVRMFFAGNRVSALYLTIPEKTGQELIEFGKNINNKIAKLDFRNKHRGHDDVVAIFGKPSQYVWGEDVFKEDNLPERYIMSYPDVHICIYGGRVSEVRFDEPGYVFGGGISVGSTLKDVLKVLPGPSDIIVGEEIGFVDGVLYMDAEGRAGWCYYGRKDKGVRMFFSNKKVGGLYLTLWE